MSYQVLARKWRPRSFASVVGQEHVVTALTHALEQQRLHHAYLLTGTRGVGKTTLARILAKALNCETGITPTPCGKCSACVEIDAGRFVDLIEVDAATNTKVDEMRQLLESAVYAPTRARFKVYVIDEVHMLSTSAFNAMLKTLEEPPEHVKFILATTDPQKIPVTVLSRCLQFNLKQMLPGAIAAHLQHIAKEEDVAADAGALRLIASAARGSMRDALSVLDQAIAYCGGTVTEAGVRTMLGAVDQTYLFDLADAVAAGDGDRLFSIADAMEARSLSFDGALAELATLLHRIALAQVVPDALDPEMPERGRVLSLAQHLDPETVQLYYQIAVHGRRDLPLAPDEYAGFTMSLMRMLAFRPDATGEGSSDASTAKSASRGGPLPGKKVARAVGGASKDETGPRGAPGDSTDWPDLVRELKVTGATRQLAERSELAARTDHKIELRLPAEAKYLADKVYVDKLKAALHERLGKPVAVLIEIGASSGNSVAAMKEGERKAHQEQANASIQGDSFVRDLVEQFDGSVVDSSIKPST
ncbi:MAG: DNA polymerase III subunit gamma/tau [Burkholderiales bacterium]